MNEQRSRAPPAPSARAWPGLVASIGIVLVFLLATARLTGNFEHWTYESSRRAHAAAGQLRAVATPLIDTGGATHTLFAPPAEASPRPPAVLLVDFIYTRCPSVCQALGSEYFRMQQALAAEGRHGVQLWSISLDPAHDGPAALTAHARLHRTDAAWWTLATPRDVPAAQALMRSLGVVAVPDGFGGFVHNASIHLLSDDGRVHAIFEPAEWPQALAAALALASATVPSAGAPAP